MPKSKKSIKKKPAGKVSKKKLVKKKVIKETKPFVFAIIKIGGKQYKVKEKDTISVDKLETKEGQDIEFDDVLLTACENDIKIGTPKVSGAKVKTKVIEQGKDKKAVVFKYKPKKRYRKTYGHRQKYTKLEILKILTK